MIKSDELERFPFFSVVFGLAFLEHGLNERNAKSTNGRHFDWNNGHFHELSIGRPIE